MPTHPTSRRAGLPLRLLAFCAAAALAFIGEPLAAEAAPPVASPQFVQVAASRSDGSTYGVVLGVTEDGRLYSWGRDDSGLLGQGPGVTEQLTPTEVQTLPPFTDESDRIVQVAIGSTHALALTLQGKVYAWGDNSHGQLGVGDTDPHPTPVNVPQGTFPNLNFHAITQVAAGGGGHSLALGADGQVYSWGANDLGQLGTGDHGTDHASPQLVMPAGSAKSVTAGTATSFAITPTGGVRGWGANSFGQVGTGEWSWLIHDVPRIVPYFEFLPVKQVVASTTYTAALTVSGDVYMWGYNDPAYHPFGFSEARQSTDPIYPAPTWMGDMSTYRFPGLATGETIVAISIGETSSAAFTSTGSLFAWGGNDHGQLGLGDHTQRSTPTRVLTFPAVRDGAPLTQLSMGDYGMAVVSESGGVYGVGIHGGSTGDAAISPITDDVPLFTNIRIADLAGSVAIDPEPEPGVAVSAVLAGWNPGATFRYQWRLDGADIPGATGAQYTPSDADNGHQLAVAVSAVAENFGAATVVSAAAAVLGPAAPEITTTTLPGIDAGGWLYAPIATTGTAPITFTGDIPDGFSLDANTGVLSGTAELVGDYPVRITATNAYGVSTVDLVIHVAPGDLDNFVLQAAPSNPVPGDDVEITALGYDEFGNAVGDVTYAIEFTSSDPDDDVDDNVVTVPTAGERIITGTGFEGMTAQLVLNVSSPNQAPVITTPTPTPAPSSLEPSSPAPSSPAPSSPAPADVLSTTGADAMPLLLVAAILLAAGVAVIVVRR